MSWRTGTIFENITDVDDLDLTDRVRVDGANRSPASRKEVDKLKGAVEGARGEHEERDPSKIDKETLRERQKLRAAKQLESRLKLVSDLVEVQKGMQELNQAKLNFYQMSSQADINKTLIDQEMGEILGAGQAQAGLERARGETASELSQLKLAAQGQKLSGEGAKAVSDSHKIMAATRAADARTNALSRAMGLELEKVAIDRQVAYGELQKRLAYQSGFTRMAYGIADAAIRFKGGTTSDGAKKDTTKDTTETKTDLQKYRERNFPKGHRFRDGSRNPASLNQNPPWVRRATKEELEKLSKTRRRDGSRW